MTNEATQVFKTQVVTSKFIWTELTYPPYSTDLAPISTSYETSKMQSVKKYVGMMTMFSNK
jgi:hypothetical protein